MKHAIGPGTERERYSRCPRRHCEELATVEIRWRNTTWPEIARRDRRCTEHAREFYEIAGITVESTDPDVSRETSNTNEGSP